MSFTDDDLKRLKIDSEAWVSPYWDRRKIQALLARLETAEACARTGMNYRLKREEKSKDWKEHLEYFDQNWAKWRTIAGQDPKVYQRDAWRKAAGIVDEFKYSEAMVMAQRIRAKGEITMEVNRCCEKWVKQVLALESRLRLAEELARAVKSHGHSITCQDAMSCCAEECCCGYDDIRQALAAWEEGK
jgi:hypothetical protein